MQFLHGWLVEVLHLALGVARGDGRAEVTGGEILREVPLGDLRRPVEREPGLHPGDLLLQE